MSWLVSAVKPQTRPTTSYGRLSVSRNELLFYHTFQSPFKSTSIPLAVSYLANRVASCPDHLNAITLSVCQRSCPSSALIPPYPRTVAILPLLPGSVRRLTLSQVSHGNKH